MVRRLLIAVVGVLLMVGALVGTKIEQFRTMGEVGAAMVPPPQVVTAATAAEDEWENTLPAIGTLTPVQGVTLTAEIPGKIERIAFDSGTAVEQGDILVELDTSTEAATLRAAKATAALTLENLKRTRDLRKDLTTSQAELDAAQARHEEAEAQVESLVATISKKTIRAPFTGRLGMRQVDLGEVLMGGAAITTLQILDPIYVDFTLPQQHLSVLDIGTPLRVSTDAAPGTLFEGRINAVSPDVDSATRNVRLQGTIPNAEELLRAGMFVDVEVVLPVREQVLAVPITAVHFAPFGNSVFVIEEGTSGAGEDNATMVRQRFVRLGTRRGDFVAVSAGLEAGERVVSTGVFKLRSGMAVTVDNTLAPDASLEPTPDNT